MHLPVTKVHDKRASIREKDTRDKKKMVKKEMNPETSHMFLQLQEE
jgi:hypothetical protein